MGQDTRTCNSPIRTDVDDVRVTVSTPDCPPPAHDTDHVVVAVTV
jgi:hypothetical protein